MPDIRLKTRIGTRIALFITGWLAAGWLIAPLLQPAPGGLLWWMLLGVPFASVMLVLALGFATAIIGLGLSLLRPGRTASALRR